ncbi:tRNA-dihydrouridine(20a/20b) synthase [NAD(P)+]-like [Clavelina lepadiformis]|uniref:tRNA-dihydrouridine(20a/20b) synthase [NAD(P)+]-like n=1 Tax=Clavelina lepadiformis TaxID=159417 RepID=UPI0040433620
MQEVDQVTRKRTNIVQLLQKDGPTKICAPMVRYSKLQFRTLVRKYGCDIAYTPMVVSDSFVQSEECRKVEFITNENDKPLIVQFAANNPEDFASATEMVFPYCDGVGLNCGCPQRWAMAKGYGAKLLRNPEQLVDYIRFTRSRLQDPDFSISTKIRLHADPHKTVEMCRRLENVGVSFISVHGRTTKERHQPVHYDQIKLIKDAVSVPVVANGDVKSLTDVYKVYEETGADGIMVARGILKNPAMFEGYDRTPMKCVQDWLNICSRHETSFTCFHNHLIYMLEKRATKEDKQIFNNLRSIPAVIEYLDKYKDDEESVIDETFSNMKNLDVS